MPERKFVDPNPVETVRAAFLTENSANMCVKDPTPFFSLLEFNLPGALRPPVPFLPTG